MGAEILVLGGGYVGVWAARKVARAVRAGRLRDVRVTLVSAAPEHSFHGWTAEVITGHVRPERARVALTDLLPGVEIVRGTVTHVDAERRTVEVATGAGIRTLSYDHLVVGVGSRDAVERVEGLREHAWSLKDPAGLAALRRHLARIVADAAETADPAERERLLTVVVAGAGLTGVEAATAISQRLRGMAGSQPLLRGATPRVVLAHSGRMPLPSLRPRFERIADYAVTQARAAGVEILSRTRVAEVTADGADLDEAGFLRSATVVTTIGQTPVALPGLEGLARAADDRIRTDRFLVAAPGVWAGGDVAAVPHPSGSGPCPDNALWAIFHGKRIGANIVRALEGRRPLPFRFPGLGQGASLGVGRGAAELYGIQLTGWTAWLARWVFFHWFMPSRRVALMTAAEWFRTWGPASEAVPSRLEPVAAARPAQSSAPSALTEHSDAAASDAALPRPRMRRRVLRLLAVP